MAALVDADRQRVANGSMRWWSNLREALPGLVKLDIRAAVNAADDWVEANSGAYNTALPIAFRTSATASQKSLLLVAVVLMRFNITLLKRLFGEVD